MLIKIKDHRIVASEVQSFFWNKDALYLGLKGNVGPYIIDGPKTLLDEFEKQYNEIMGMCF